MKIAGKYSVGKTIDEEGDYWYIVNIKPRQGQKTRSYVFTYWAWEEFKELVNNPGMIPNIPEKVEL